MEATVARLPVRGYSLSPRAGEKEAEFFLFLLVKRAERLYSGE
jgi:hypothetical protein